ARYSEMRSQPHAFSSQFLPIPSSSLSFIRSSYRNPPQSIENVSGTGRIKRLTKPSQLEPKPLSARRPSISLRVAATTATRLCRSLPDALAHFLQPRASSSQRQRANIRQLRSIRVQDARNPKTAQRQTKPQQRALLQPHLNLG